ncbi:MAG: MFS transporter [Achromobacter sp.]|uniref:MFS transporter n=1 Tax=Achromobacter sp. TaxID=134375 RepID=UPI003D08825D
MKMHSTSGKDASWGALLQGRNGLRSIALAGGVALHAINIYVVTTILPTIIQEIGGLEYYAWNTTLFVVASIVGSAVSAKFIDALGPRLAYLSALAIFSLGAACCALAPSMPVLLLGRAVQGLGGGVLFALSYALIRVVFEAHLWPRAMALVSGMWGVATLCGPAVGGVFAQSGQWRLAFWVLLPIALLLAAIVASQVQRCASAAGASTLPWLSITLLVLSVLAISSASLSESLVWNMAGIAAGVVLVFVIAKRDKRGSVKLLPSGAWSLSAPLGVVYAMMVLLVIGLTTEIFVPYFLQVIHQMTPLAAGYMTAMMAGGWTLASLYSAGRGEGRAAYRFIRLGPPIVLAALLSLAFTLPSVTWGSSMAGRGMYGVALAAVGFGIGLSWPHLLTRVFSVAAPGEETLASSSITTVQLYATALAAAIAGVVANLAGLTDPGGVDGAKSAALVLFASFAAAPALGAVLSARMERHP